MGAMKRALAVLGLAPAGGRIAQLVEQLTLNQRVQGSNPCAPTNEINDLTIIQPPPHHSFSLCGATMVPKLVRLPETSPSCRDSAFSQAPRPMVPMKPASVFGVAPETCRRFA